MDSDATINWVCPSCGRTASSGSNGVQIVRYLDQEWCGRCAKVRTINGRTFVAQPSPGRMIRGSVFDELDSWRDCFGAEPIHRIKVSDAKQEIQRAWSMWEENKSSAMAMFLF